MSRDRGRCAEATTRESQRGCRQIESTGLLAGSSRWLALSRKESCSGTRAEHKRTCGRRSATDNSFKTGSLSYCRQGIVVFAGYEKGSFI